jgi:hypothetical protein
MANETPVQIRSQANVVEALSAIEQINAGVALRDLLKAVFEGWLVEEFEGQSLRDTLDQGTFVRLLSAGPGLPSSSQFCHTFGS